VTTKIARKMRDKTALPNFAMKLRLLAVVLVLALVPSLAFAQRPGRPGQQKERREELETQIVQRFLNHVAMELQLDGNTRARLEQHLRQTAARRRALAQSTVQLRGQMLRAVRDSSTADAEFTRLIGEMTRLRGQEEDMWRSDQESLRGILTPRQHARFVVMWIRFNEQIRDAAMRRPGPPAR
jgi:hypothetical protein